jgi:tetratricopeptide (TPR) repeat protein
MKSERRHELATNELADWIANFPNWFKENLTSVVIGVIVVAALIAYTIYFYSRENQVWNQKNAIITSSLDQISMNRQTAVQGKSQGVSVSDLFQSNANVLEKSASETDNQVLSALALVKRAEALRTELHYRTTPAEPDVRNNQLKQALKSYEDALPKAKSDPQIAAMAQFGIGLTYEDMGNFDEAKKAYEKVVNDPAYKGTTYQSRAEVRINTMNDNQRQVVFAKSEKPQTPPTKQIQPPGPLNLEGHITDTNKLSVPKSEGNKPK